jgi:hypothetical protein
MMEGMISFMTDINPEKGIGYINTTDIEKNALANDSLSWNKNNELFKTIFYDIDEILQK